MKPTEKQIDELKNSVLMKGLCEAFGVPFEELFVVQNYEEPTALAKEPKDKYDKTYPLTEEEFDDLIAKIKDFRVKSSKYIEDGIELNGFWSEIFDLVLDLIEYIYDDRIREAFDYADWNNPPVENIKKTLLSYYE